MGCGVLWHRGGGSGREGEGRGRGSGVRHTQESASMRPSEPPNRGTETGEGCPPSHSRPALPSMQSRHPGWHWDPPPHTHFGVPPFPGSPAYELGGELAEEAPGSPPASLAVAGRRGGREAVGEVLLVPDRPELPGVEGAAALDASGKVRALGEGAADVVGGGGGHGSPLGGRAVREEEREVTRGGRAEGPSRPLPCPALPRGGGEKPRPLKSLRAPI